MRVRNTRARKGKAFSLLMAVLLAMQLLPLNLVQAAEADASAEGAKTPQAEALFLDEIPRALTMDDDFFIHDREGNSTDTFETANIHGNAKSFLKLNDIEITGDSPVELNNVKAGETIQLQYGFHISNEKYDDVHPGDYFEIDIPKSIVFAPDAVIRGEIKSGETVFATWAIDTSNNKAIVTIADDYDDLTSDIYGYFGFTGTFAYLPSDNDDGETSQIQFGSETITIKRTPGNQDGTPPVASTVAKSHDYDPSTNEITWTVEITPPADVTDPDEIANYDYGGYTMVDQLTGAHTYENGSFEVLGLGTGGGFAAPDPSATYNPTGKTITYTFPTGTKGPQTVHYKTMPAISPGTASNKFENEVKLSKGSYPNLGSAKDSFEMKNFFGKAAGTDIIVDGNNRYVEWKVTVTLPKSGTGAYTFPDLKLIDTLPTDGVQHHFVPSGTAGGKNLAPKLGTDEKEVVESSVPNLITDGDKGKFYMHGKELVYLFTDTEATTNSNNTTKTMVLTYYTKIDSWDVSSGSNDSIKAENKAKVEWNWGPSSPWGTGSGNNADIGEIIVGKEIIKQGASIRKEAGDTVNFDHSSNEANKGDYLKWTITVNERLRTDMGNAPNTVSITDFIPVTDQDLHKLVIDADHPLTVTEKGSPEVVKKFTSESGSDPDLGTLSDVSDTGFTFTFSKYGSDFNKKYTVTFYTKLTDTALSEMYQNKASGATSDITKSFKNEATLTPGVLPALTVNATQTYNLEMLSKSGSYNYAKRELVWKMVVNRNRLDMTNAVVTDTLPENTRLNPESGDAIKVKVNGGSEEKTLAELNIDFASTPAGESTPASFTLTWPTGDSNKTSDMYEIFITTHVEEKAVLSQGAKTFENNATLNIGEHTGAFEAKSTKTINNDIVDKSHDYGSGKDAEGNDKDTITWTVALNKAKIDLQDAKAEDTLNNSLSLIPDSIELYRASINPSNGNLTLDGAALTKVPGSTPTVTLGENEYGIEIDLQKLTVSLPDGPHAYVLKFTTSVLGQISPLTNTVFFKGSNTSPQAKDDIVGINVVDPYANGGSGSYVLKVSKIDENGDPLNGVKLQLVSAKGDFQYKSGVDRAPFGETGATQTLSDSTPTAHTIQENGVIVFDKLPPWTFYVRELEPAPGYLLVEGNFGGVKPTQLSGITFAGAPNDSITTAAHITVENVKGLANVQINKVSAGDVPLAGAEFGLFEKGKSGNLTNLLKTATSATGTGAVIFSDVPFGEYEIKELSTPAMHKPNTTLVYVKVGYKELSPSGYDYTTAEVRYSTDGTNYNSTSTPKFVNTPNNTGTLGNPDIVFKKLRANRPGDPTAPLQDVVFTLKDKNGTSIITSVGNSGTAKSGADGIVQFTDVPFGEYTIFESVPTEYLNPSDNPVVTPVFRVNVTHRNAADPRLGLKVMMYDAAGVLTYDSSDSAAYPNVPDLINYAAVGEVKFAKKHVSSNSILIQGGTFEISGTSEAGHVFSITANAVDGVVTFRNVPVGNDYVIKETVPPSGYTLTSKTITDVNVEYADSATRRSVVDVDLTGTSDPDKFLTNTPAPSSPSDGKVSVMKEDEAGKPLAGAEFTLYDSTGKAIASATSGSNGLAEFTGLAPYSSFTIRETRAPDGYVLSSEELKVSTTNATVRSFTVVNKKVTVDAGAILVLKTDPDGKPLSGAEFTLYDNAGNAVATGTTGADGKVSFGNLPAGQYTVAETRVPSGYVRVAGNQDVTLSANETRSLTVVNEAKPNIPSSVLGSIRLMKVNSDREPLAGAEFTLYAADGSVFARETTGSNGLAVFTNLPIGEYTVRETAAPDGYWLIEDSLSVTLPGSGAAQSYTLKDASLEEEPEVAGWEEDGIPGKLPQTGSAAPSFFLLLTGIALAVTGFVWSRKEGYFPRRRKK